MSNAFEITESVQFGHGRRSFPVTNHGAGERAGRCGSLEATVQGEDVFPAQAEVAGDEGIARSHGVDRGDGVDGLLVKNETVTLSHSSIVARDAPR